MTAENGWCVVGNHGLYTGWWMTRKAAIAGHVRAYMGTASWSSRELDHEERALWETMKREGDRPVKVTISWKNGK